MLTNTLSYLVTGYPYFSILYLVLFWKKIKPDDTILNTSNLIYVVLSLPSIYFFLEIIISWYAGNMYEQFYFTKRAYGSWELFISISFSVILAKQIFWLRRFRLNKTTTIIISILSLFILYYDEIIHFVLLHIKTDFLPSMWLSYKPWYIKYLLTPLRQTLFYGFVVFIVVSIKKTLVQPI